MVDGSSIGGKGFQDARYRALIEQLVVARRAARLSQSGLALILGRHQQFVSRYETGERRLDAVEFVDIARALGRDPAAMIVDIKSPK